MVSSNYVILALKSQNILLFISVVVSVARNVKIDFRILLI